MSLTPQVIKAHTTSAENDGATVTAGGATMVVGGIAPNKHIHLRFATAALITGDIKEIAYALLSVKVSAVGAAQMACRVFASDFGAAIAIADYNLSAVNALRGSTPPYRVELKDSDEPNIFDGAAVVSTWYTQVLPSIYINEDAAVNSGYSDFEIRPVTATTLAGETVTIHGPGATEADKPKLELVLMELSDFEFDSDYRFTGVGVEGFVAFALEETPGVAQKGKYLLDVNSHDLDSNAANLFAEAMSNTRVLPTKMGVGGVAAGGSFAFDVTPEVWSTLIPGFMKHSLTTVGADNNTHDFTKAESREVRSYTFMLGKGAYVLVFPGCKIDTFSISASVGEIVRASASIVGLEPYLYGLKDVGINLGYVLDAAAASDSIDNGILTFVGAEVLFNGEAVATVRDITLSFANGARTRKGLDKRRGPSSVFAGRSTVAVSMSLYFSDWITYRKFLGISGTGYPVKPGKRIYFDEVTLDMEAAEGVDGRFTFTLPKTGYQAISSPVQDLDSEIILSVEGFAALDSATGTNLTLEVINDLAEAAYTTGATDLITVLPLDA